MSFDVHICYGTNVRYVPMVRDRGCRTWVKVGNRRFISRIRAATAMVKAIENGHFWHGVLWMEADYYDPLPVLEMKRK